MPMRGALRERAIAGCFVGDGQDRGFFRHEELAPEAANVTNGIPELAAVRPETRGVELLAAHRKHSVLVEQVDKRVHGFVVERFVQVDAMDCNSKAVGERFGREHSVTL